MVYASEVHVTSVWGSSLVCDPRRTVVDALDAGSVKLRISALIQVECDNINLVSNTTLRVVYAERRDTFLDGLYSPEGKVRKDM